MDKYLPFNRTNMELKPVMLGIISTEQGTFNRTNMELKHMKRKKGFIFSSLLIAPIWN